MRAQEYLESIKSDAMINQLEGLKEYVATDVVELESQVETVTSWCDDYKARLAEAEAALASATEQHEARVAELAEQIVSQSESIESLQQTVEARDEAIAERDALLKLAPQGAWSVPGTIGIS